MQQYEPPTTRDPLWFRVLMGILLGSTAVSFGLLIWAFSTIPHGG